MATPSGELQQPPPSNVADIPLAPQRILDNLLDVTRTAAQIQPLPMAESDASGSDHDDSDNDDEANENGGSVTRWYHVEEDRSLPCEDELAYISSKKECSAQDHQHWETKVFAELDDPEIVPGESGRIEWLIDNFNGTKERPNNEHLMKSSVVRIGGLDWQIKLYPRGNNSDYLSAYVECISMLSPEYDEFEEFATPPFPFLQGAVKTKKRRSVAAQIGIVMYNPAEPRVQEHRFEAHQFHKQSADYGWKYFSQMPRSEFHLRQHTQRQAILRDDKLAFTAYVRVVTDSTGCMWQHDTSPPDDTSSVTGLRPFTKSFNYIAIAVPLLHFAPFRRFVRELGEHAQIAKWLQPLLYKMYTRRRSPNYGARSMPHEGDVMEMLWRMSRNIQSQYDANTVAHFRELVGPFHADAGTPCSSNRLNTKEHESIQEAVNKHGKIIACPELLTMELQRQEHDKKARKWLKITNKVLVEDRIQVSGVHYTLYAFVTHCGHLQSTQYNAYVRPNGIGNGWYSYQDGSVTRLTEKQARQIHSGSSDQDKNSKFTGYDSAFTGFHEHTGEVTCVVMYVRRDAAKEAFASPLEEVWAPYCNTKESEAIEPPQTAVHESFAGQYGPCETYREPGSVTAHIILEDQANSLRQTAEAATTPEPTLYDGEDVIMKDADNDSTFSLDLPDGESFHNGLDNGTLDWLGRPYYSGEYLDAKYHGGGHLIALNGDEYLGIFKNGLQHGYGKMIYSSTGNVYEGEWSEGEHHGRGKLTEFTTGNVFEGGWKNGQKHGQFVLKGTVTEEDKGWCTICYCKEMSTAFYDCGHVVACHDCATALDTCPVCRKRILARLQLYGVRMTLA